MSEDGYLPLGWVETTLTEIGRWRGGGTPSMANRRFWDNGSIPWVSPKDMKSLRIVDSQDRISALAVESTTVKPFEPGTVLIVIRSGILARTLPVAVSGVRATMNQDLKGITPFDRIDPFYLAYYMRANERAILNACCKDGTTVASIDIARLKDFTVHLARVDEQRRIVTKIEEILSDLEAGVAALKRVQVNLKRYRAAVLKSAVEGKLTEEWRVKHPPKETGTELLKRILKERRRKWEEEQLAAFSAAGKAQPKDWRRRYQECESPETPGLPTIPAGWCWATVDQVAEVQGGIQKQPKRRPRENAFPYLRVANVLRNRLDLSEVNRIELFGNEFKKLRLQRGDLLVVEGNGSKTEIGRSAIWNEEIEDCVHQNHIIRVRFLAGVPRYLNSYWNSPHGVGRVMAQSASTSGLYTLSVTKVSQMPIPLPPEEEQREIVRQIEERLSIADLVAFNLEKETSRATRLRQAILKQAFEGKLVEQDPADEPASELLARIKKQRQPTPTTPAVAISSPPPAKVPKDVFLRRTAIVSYTVRRLAKHPSFGRTQLEKILHLAQSHLGIELRLQFERYHAGPFDKSIYKLEGTAQKNGWFRKQDRKTKGVTYHPGPKIESMCAHAVRCLGPKQANFDRLLDHIAKMDTDQAELFATAYAAWNDLLIDDRPADDDHIIAEIYAWHESKQKFTRERISICISWMRKNGYVPNGIGERTSVVTKKARRPRKGRTGMR